MLRRWYVRIMMGGMGLFAVSLAFLSGFSLVNGDAPVVAFEHEEFPEEIIDPLYNYGFFSASVYDDAYEAAEGVAVDASTAIVAHHLLVADEIAEVFESIADEDVETVVILSPNHFAAGVSPAQISVEAWMTPYGAITTDLAAVEKLLSVSEVLFHEEWAFENEHGISGITPFIRRSFPNAKMVPIILDESFPAEDAELLGRQIAEEFPDAVVIASIDMSHNMPRHAQGYHDEVTKDYIAYGGDQLTLEIDSNASLRALHTVNEVRGTEVFHLTHHDSSLNMFDSNEWRENTSHILGYFTEGEAEEPRFASLHFVGDIMLDRGVRKNIDAARDIGYPWEEMDRFMMGSHLRIGNLEGTVNNQTSTYTYNPPFRFVFAPEFVEEMGKRIDVVSLANNHTRDVGLAGEIETQEQLDALGIPWFGGWNTPTPRYDTTINGFDVTLIGYHQFAPSEDELRDVIELADAEGRYIIVMPHWGNEYINAPQTNQRRLAQVMVDAGADLVIGGHPHVPQGIEIIDGVPVVYSLGNFVFDQEIPSTWNAFTLGVILEEAHVTMHLLPVYTRGGQPVPLSDIEAQTVFDLVASVSDEDIQSQIKQGILTVPYGD